MDNPQIDKTEPEKKPGCLCGDKSKCKFICHSKTFKIITVAAGLILIILVSFAAGVGIAFHKARFSCFRVEGSGRNFSGPQMMRTGEDGPRGIFRKFEGRDFRNAHGLAGTITSILENSIVVKDRDNKETIVSISDQTIIRSDGINLKISDLKQDDEVVVMGKPGDNGLVNANLIRVFKK